MTIKESPADTLIFAIALCTRFNSMVDLKLSRPRPPPDRRGVRGRLDTASRDCRCYAPPPAGRPLVAEGWRPCAGRCAGDEDGNEKAPATAEASKMERQEGFEPYGPRAQARAAPLALSLRALYQSATLALTLIDPLLLPSAGDSVRRLQPAGSSCRWQLLWLLRLRRSPIGSSASASGRCRNLFSPISSAPYALLVELGGIEPPSSTHLRSLAAGSRLHTIMFPCGPTKAYG